MSIEDTVKDIVRKYSGGSYHWKIGDRVRHPDGRLVEIMGGCYLDPKYGRVSNFWYWRQVMSDGSYGEEEHGYGWDSDPET